MATILIVEDKTTLLILAESVLRSAGYETVSASNRSEAGAILRSDRHIDVVATDISLGDDDRDGGLELAQTAAKARPGTPVLYVSGRALTDGMKELFVERSSFLEKPYTDEQLVSAVAE